MDFQQRQAMLAAHIRDPANAAAPAGIEDRRLAIYRDLFFNNLDNFLRGVFPVCCRLLGDVRWSVMVREFMVSHRCETPYFLEISQEFLQCLMQGRVELPADMPYLPELAHYEWVELALDTLDVDWPDADPQGDVLTGIPVVSPLAWNLRYGYPVHQLGEALSCPDPGETCLVVCRGRDEKVQFSVISPQASSMLALLQEKSAQGWSGQRCLQHLMDAWQPADPDVWWQGACGVLGFFRQREILLGSQPCQVGQ